jgi:hypothetical protein
VRLISNANGIYGEYNMSNKVRYVLLLVGLLAAIVWFVSRYLVPFLPDSLESNMVFYFAVLVIVMAVLASFKNILELVEIFIGKPPRSGYIGRNTFILHITKAQFERELDEFVNKSRSSVLSSWRILRRRTSEQERRLRHRMDAENRDWDIVTSITETDAIKLTTNQYRGIVLELTEKENGLWVVVYPEGDRESITVSEDGLYRHKGYKTISVDPEAQEKLMEWLKTLT